MTDLDVATTRATIPGYRLPGPDELPPNRVDWQVDPRRAVLLVHDMQKYFVDFFADHAMRGQLVDNVSRLVRAARGCRVPVIYTAQPGSMTQTQRGLVAAFWGAGMRATPRQRDIVDGCAPVPGEITVPKWRYSAFANNGLAQIITDSGRDQVIICGVFASIGCLVTAVESFSRDWETFLVADAMADFSRRDHLRALDHAARCCAVVQRVDNVAAACHATGVSHPAGPTHPNHTREKKQS
jgi:bifunctional isochorismate lyase/aryl carrier protein